MLSEDAWVENTQAMLYFLAGVICCCTGLQYQRSFMKLQSSVLYFYAICLLFFAAEEISWGQRIFGLTAPDFFLQRNAQKELGFHNLKPFHNSMNSAYLYFSAMAVMLCLLSRLIPYLERIRLHFLCPPWWLFPYFGVGFWHCYRLAELNRGLKQMPWSEQEVAELLFALAFFLHSFYLLRSEKWRPSSKEP